MNAWAKFMMTAARALTLQSLTSATPGTTTGFGGGLTIVDRDVAVVNGSQVQKIGSYQTTARTVVLKIVKRNSAGNYDIVYSQSYAHGGTGWEDMTMTTHYNVPGSGEYLLATYATGANVNVNAAGNRAFFAGDATGSSVTFTEDAADSVTAQRASYYA